jgi:hypothetical protein
MVLSTVTTLAGDAAFSLLATLLVLQPVIDNKAIEVAKATNFMP